MPVICHPRSRDRVLGTPQVGDFGGKADNWDVISGYTSNPCPYVAFYSRLLNRQRTFLNRPLSLSPQPEQQKQLKKKANRKGPRPAESPRVTLPVEEESET